MLRNTRLKLLSGWIFTFEAQKTRGSIKSGNGYAYLVFFGVSPFSSFLYFFYTSFLLSFFLSYLFNILLDVCSVCILPDIILSFCSSFFFTSLCVIHLSLFHSFILTFFLFYLFSFSIFMSFKLLVFPPFLSCNISFLFLSSLLTLNSTFFLSYLYFFPPFLQVRVAKTDCQIPQYVFNTTC